MFLMKVGRAAAVNKEESFYLSDSAAFKHSI